MNRKLLFALALASMALLGGSIMVAGAATLTATRVLEPLTTPATASSTPTPTSDLCGLSWRVIPSPNLGTAGNNLNAIAVVSSGDVWAVGSSGGQTLIEHWNGTSWSMVSSPNVGPLNGVAAVS